MKKMIVLIALLAAASTASGQRRFFNSREFNVREEETIRQTLEFSSGGGTKLLEIDNVQGSIRVSGYDGRNVEMVVQKKIRATSDDDLRLAKQEVRLDIRDKAETISVFVDQPGHDRSTLSSSRSNWANRDYIVSFDFEVRVPRNSSIHLWTVNDGDIQVQDIAGDFEVSHVNGRIDLRDVSGSGRARTVNGAVKVAFRSNPQRNSSFSTVNGDIEVALQRNLSADLRYKSFNGGVYTDFPVSAIPSTPTTAERINGRFVYRNNGFSSARVGNGGPELTFDGFNGDVRILEAK
jgi:hypothetical protein